MKLSTVALALSALVATVSAQGLNDIPPCARNCATKSLPSNCNPIDAKCICSEKSFIQGITCCVADSCSKEEQEATVKAAQQICGGVGVHDLPQSVSCPSGSATGTATAPTGSTSSEGTSTASGAEATATGSSKTASSSTAAESATATSPGATSSATTGGAALVAQTQNSGFIAGVGAAAAYIAMRVL